MVEGAVVVTVVAGVAVEVVDVGVEVVAVTAEVVVVGAASTDEEGFPLNRNPAMEAASMAPPSAKRPIGSHRGTRFSFPGSRF